MGKIKGFSKLQLEAIHKQGNVFWDAAERSMDPFFLIVNEMERLTRVLLPEELETTYAQFQDRSALVPPDIHNNLKSLRAHIRKALFRKAPYFKLSIAGRRNLKNEAIDKAEQVLQQILDEENEGKGFPLEADKAIFQALYCGLSCTMTTWTRVFARKVRRDPDTLQFITDKNGAPVYDISEVAAYPETKAIDIRRTRIDPSAAEAKDIRIVGIHGLQQQSELLELNDNPNTHYQFDEKELKESSFDRGTYFEKVKSEAETYQEKSQQNEEFGDKIVEVKSIRGLFRVPVGNKEEVRDLIVEIANGTVLLAVKDNDLPIAGWELFDWPAPDEQSDRMFVMGLIEPIRDLFLEMFVKRNQSLDAASRNTYVTYIADRDATASLPNYVESANDQILKIDVAGSGLQSINDAMALLPRPRIDQNTFDQSQFIKTEVQQGMQLNDFVQGIDPGRKETATAVNALTGGAAVLTELLIDKLTDTFFRPVIRKKLILWNFFKGEQEQTITTNSGEVIKIAPGELDLPFHITADTSIGLTNPTMQRRLIEILPLWMQNPRIDQDVLLQTVADVLELPNADTILLNINLLKSQIDKESVALGKGIPQPVHPLDNHSEHIRQHTEYLNFIQSNPDAVAQGISEEPIMEHIEQHQAELEKINSSLGNSKDLGGGAPNPDAGAGRAGISTGKTGNFTPSESRR